MIRALALTLPLSLLAFAVHPTAALETAGAGDGAQSPADCALLNDLARNGRSSDERAFALRALSQCPRSDAVRSTLEYSVVNDDAACRKSALESLGAHMTHASQSVILDLYRRGKCDADKSLCYRYASQLAVPKDRDDLLSMAKEGIVSSNRGVRTAALIMAGKILAESEKARIRRAFTDKDPVVAGAALAAAAYFPSDAFFLEEGIAAMRSTDAAVQSQAILLTAHTGGERARAALVHLEFSGLYETNRPLLIDVLQKMGALGRSAVTLQPVRLHTEPSDNAPLAGVLEADRVVYIEETGRNLHTSAGVVSNWIKVRSAEGARGWVRGKDVRAHDAIASRDLPAKEQLEKNSDKKGMGRADESSSKEEGRDIRDLPFDNKQDKQKPEEPKKQGSEKRKFTPVSGTDWDDVAHYFAGMPVPATSPLAPITNTNEFAAHRASMDRMFAAFETSHLSKMRAWSEKELGDPGTPVLFYPFGGPDMVISQSFFPHVKDFVLFGLEDPGRPPNPLAVDPGKLGRGLAGIQHALHSIVNYTFFQTKLMEQDLYASDFKGVAPLLLVFIARTGNKVTDVCEVWVDNAGNLSEIADDSAAKTNREVPGRVSRKSLKTPGIPGIRIHFEKAGRQRTATFFQVNVDDTHIAQTPYFLKYIRSMGDRSVYIKAASYLLHWGNFNLIRAFIHDESKLILQDDTGIPLRMFDQKVWGMTFYGNYIQPIPLFAGQYQPDLRHIYVLKTGVRALPFTIGYTFGPGASSLILAKRKP
ncbi:MAG: hypothetical protein HY042_01235 [Spirochaetia bacterium]|nr:hypothetical protein [Spirochaetia bacterium]